MEILSQQQTVKYAGFWRRFLAYLIDSIILGIIEMILFIPIIVIFGLSFFSWDTLHESEEFVMRSSAYFFQDEYSIAFLSIYILLIFGMFIFSILINWLYFALMESSYRQATLGKMALGLKVTDIEGKRISFGKASGRYFGKILSGMILYIGFIMVAFTEKKQGLHDMLANTLVIDTY